MTDIFIAKLQYEVEGYAFLSEACYYDEDWEAWRIKQQTETMGGKDAAIFIQNLIAYYRTLSYATVNEGEPQLTQIVQ
jgi:hypothetical protein